MRGASAFDALAVACIALAAPCLAQETENEQLLAWVEAADPQSVLRADLAAGNRRFFAVAGVAVSVPGVAYETYAHCYAPHVSITLIDGTSDFRTTRREHELNSRAEQFALAYNEAALAAHGRERIRDCAAAPSWLEAVEAVLPSPSAGERPKARVMPLGAIALSVPSAELLTPQLRGAICAAGDREPQTRAFAVVVSTPGQPDIHFGCAEGREIDAGTPRSPAAAPAPPPSR